MIISAESPLRRLPADLPREQVISIDALRLSAEMADFSLQKLNSLLANVVKEKKQKGVCVEAIVYAYGVVDAVNRFREVLRCFRGLKHNVVYKLFMRQTRAIESLRDVMQHLNSELRCIRDRRSAALGTITWLGPSPNEESPATMWVLQPGSFYQQQTTFGPMVDFEASVPPGEIREVCIVTSEVRVDLTDAVERTRTMIASLEQPIRGLAYGKELLALLWQIKGLLSKLD